MHLSLYLVVESLFIPASCHGVYLIDKDDGWFFLSGHFEKGLDDLFWLSNPFWDEIRGWYWEESCITFCSTCFRQESLSRSWRTVEEDTSPRLDHSLKNVWESDWQNHCFMKSFLCILESCHIWPFHIRLLKDNCFPQRILKFIIIIPYKCLLYHNFIDILWNY